MIRVEQQESSMRYRIAMWAGAGFLVAGIWAVYFFLTAPVPIASGETIWTLARLTCPIAFVSFYFHLPVGIYEVFVANAATYALVGLTVETVRHRLRQAR
jgi:hypothetical protein